MKKSSNPVFVFEPPTKSQYENINDKFSASPPLNSEIEPLK